jgi:hypothetical protein
VNPNVLNPLGYSEMPDRPFTQAEVDAYFDLFTYRELQQRCRMLRMRATGTRADLLARCRDFDRACRRPVHPADGGR